MTPHEFVGFYSISSGYVVLGIMRWISLYLSGFCIAESHLLYSPQSLLYVILQSVMPEGVKDRSEVLPDTLCMEATSPQGFIYTSRFHAAVPDILSARTAKFIIHTQHVLRNAVSHRIDYDKFVPVSDPHLDIVLVGSRR